MEEEKIGVTTKEKRGPIDPTEIKNKSVKNRKTRKRGFYHYQR